MVQRIAAGECCLDGDPEHLLQFWLADVIDQPPGTETVLDSGGGFLRRWTRVAHLSGRIFRAAEALT